MENEILNLFPEKVDVEYFIFIYFIDIDYLPWDTLVT